MAGNPKIEVEIGGKIKDLEQKLKQADTKLQNTGKEFGKLNQFAIGALQGIAAAFSVAAIANFGRAVIDTTAKFQKFEAVLSNTLGSESAAAQALQTITDFATKTPFQVDELTDAFVKLANQGFKPTINELRSLGDLAASTGKSFDQLAEAIIDAQVGEFERLKEFGIRAKKEGDNVTFTFKGVETQVKATDSAIRDYILSLGNAVGVSGAMEKISGTLGGKLSNLEDNIEQLKLAIGDQTSGVFAASIDWLNEFIQLATNASKSVAQIRAEASNSKITSAISANREEVEKLAESYQKLNPDLTAQAALAKAISDVSRSYREAAEGGKAFRDQSYEFGELRQIIEGFNQMAVELLSVSEGGNEVAQTFKEFSKIADEFNRKFFLEGEQAAQSYNDKLEETAERLAKIDEVAKGMTSLAQRNGITEVNVPVSESPQEDNVNPIDESVAALDNFKESLEELLPASDIFSKLTSGLKEFNDLTNEIAEAGTMEEKLKLIGEQAQLVQGAFDALGSAVKDAFGQSNSFLGTLLSSLISFAGRIVAQYFAMATAASLAGAASSAAATGPAAIFSLPVMIGTALSLVAAAFAGIGGGGGKRSVGGGIGTGSGGTFTGSGSNSFDPFKTFKIEVVGGISGEDIAFTLARSEERDN